MRLDEWRLDAACKDHARPEVFLSTRADDVLSALRCCATCSVQDDCLWDEWLFAGTNPSRVVGTRGNMEEAARRTLWRNRSRRTA